MKMKQNTKLFKKKKFIEKQLKTKKQHFETNYLKPTLTYKV